MITKSKNIIIAILTIILLIIISEIYSYAANSLWLNIIDVVSYTWDKLWWLIILIIIGIMIRNNKSSSE